MIRSQSVTPLVMPYRWMGRTLNGAARHGEGSYVIIGEQAFGTPGFGGNMSFADGQAKLAFGYVMNRHGPGARLNTRGQRLIDAAYRASGFCTSAPGFWIA